MKSIEVTYDVEVWNGKAWETGEAATKLEFIDDDTVNALIRLEHVRTSRTDEIGYLKWRYMEQAIRAIEYLRLRYYVDGSIKSIKAVGGDN